MQKSVLTAGDRDDIMPLRRKKEIFMKKTLNDKRVTIKVCDLYYNQKLTQNQICELMGLSRPTVSRILAEAQECGIVSIKIEGLDSLKHWDAEQSLKEKFGRRRLILRKS